MQAGVDQIHRRVGLPARHDRVHPDRRRVPHLWDAGEKGPRKGWGAGAHGGLGQGHMQGHMEALACIVRRRRPCPCKRLPYPA